MPLVCPLCMPARASAVLLQLETWPRARKRGAEALEPFAGALPAGASDAAFAGVANQSCNNTSVQGTITLSLSGRGQRPEEHTHMSSTTSGGAISRNETKQGMRVTSIRQARAPTVQPAPWVSSNALQRCNVRGASGRHPSKHHPNAASPSGDQERKNKKLQWRGFRPHAVGQEAPLHLPPLTEAVGGRDWLRDAY